MQSYEQMNKIYHNIKTGKTKQYAHKSNRLEIEAYKQGFEKGFERGIKFYKNNLKIILHS